jgi:serine/threonine-protein kinase
MIGRTVGNYRIVEKLGEGAMGTVYRAVDQMVDRNVAIKVLRPEIAQNGETVERFRREAVALARLNHPSIAQLYAFFREGGEYFMAMEFVPGETLEQRIGREGRLPWQAALNILSPVLDGVGHAHSLGILHRDLKPANIMLASGSHVKVMDFGIACVLNTERLTREARLVGTLEYLAPERALGKAPDARSDLYSLGIVLYEMLTGHLPFAAETDFDLIRAQLNQKPAQPHELGVALPPPVEALVMTALEKDPVRRFQNAGAFLKEAAKAAAAGNGALPPAASQAVPGGRGWLMPAVAGLALVVAGLSGFQIWRVVADRHAPAVPAANVANVASPAQPATVQPLGPAVTVSSLDKPPAAPAAQPQSQTLALPSRQAPAPDLAAVAAALAAGGAASTAPLAYAPIYNAMRIGGTQGAPVVRRAIDRRGVGFRVTPDQTRQLRDAGAPDELLIAIRNGYHDQVPAANVVPVNPPASATVAAAPPVSEKPVPEKLAPEKAVPPAAPSSVPAQHRQILTIASMKSLYIRPMPDGFDADLHDAIAKEVGSRLSLVSRPEEADAFLEVSLDEEKGRAVVGSAQRWLGLKAGQKAFVRIVVADGRILWSAEAGDRSILAGRVGDDARRIASRLAKRLKHDLHTGASL